MRDSLNYLKNRAELLGRLYRRHGTDRFLLMWHDAEFAVVMTEGLVDAHVSVTVDERTTTVPGSMLVVANVLQLRREGSLQPTDVY